MNELTPELTEKPGPPDCGTAIMHDENGRTCATSSSVSKTSGQLSGPSQWSTRVAVTTAGASEVRTTSPSRSEIVGAALLQLTCTVPASNVQLPTNRYAVGSELHATRKKKKCKEPPRSHRVILPRGAWRAMIVITPSEGWMFAEWRVVDQVESVGFCTGPIVALGSAAPCSIERRLAGASVRRSRPRRPQGRAHEGSHLDTLHGASAPLAGIPGSWRSVEEWRCGTGGSYCEASILMNYACPPLPPDAEPSH